MESRVIMIEGLPGTGKSTNSYKLMMQLERNGYKVKWFHEVTRPHPTLFFSEAGFTYDEYEAFCKTYPEATHILDSIAVYRKNTIGIDLLEVEWNYASVIGNSAFQALKSFDVWTFSHDKYVDFALEKWARFSETALLEDNFVYIFDSSIFQYQIFEFLLKSTPYENLERFIHKLVDMIKPLNPSLIYLYRKDTEATIEYLEQDRGVQSLENIRERDKSEPYYQDKSAGVEGFKQFLRDYADYAKSLFNSVDCKKVSFEISTADWKRYESEMISFLQIVEIENPVFYPSNGVYVNEALGFEIVVDGLSIKDPTGYVRKLVPKSNDEYYVECLPTVIRFDETMNIIISGIQICERWTTEGTIYKKVK